MPALSAADAGAGGDARGAPLADFTTEAEAVNTKQINPSIVKAIFSSTLSVEVFFLRYIYRYQPKIPVQLF